MMSNVLCDVNLWFIWLTQFQSLDINLRHYQTYRCTNKFIGTNCMLLLIANDKPDNYPRYTIDVTWILQTCWFYVNPYIVGFHECLVGRNCKCLKKGACGNFFMLLLKSMCQCIVAFFYFYEYYLLFEYETLIECVK